MLSGILTIARKEVLDALRDLRAVLSSAVYVIMGPSVVWLVSFLIHDNARLGSSRAVLISMMSVFTLVSAFVGGMNIAMDAIAGERERRSLLPLLMNPLPRFDLIAGKWLAVSFFSISGLLLNLAGFALVFAQSGFAMRGLGPGLLLTLSLGLVPLALLAAALELLVSTVCGNTKEAHTYLSLLVFVPMVLGLFFVFFPGGARHWWHWLPVVGQQLGIEAWMQGRNPDPMQLLILGWVTAASSLLVLLSAAKWLERDDIVYGG